MNNFKGKKQIKLTIQNKISQDGETDSFALQTNGNMYFIGSSCFIEYEALNDSSEGAVKMSVRIKISEDNQLLVTRENDLAKMRLPLELGKETLVYYRVAGANQLEFTAKLIDFEFMQNEETSGFLNCEYHLLTNGELLGQYQLKLQYEPYLV